MIYRPANPQDITPRGIALVDEAMRETSWGDEPVCPVRSLETLTEMMRDPGSLVAVAEKGDQLVGVLIASVYDAMFSDTKHASMHVWYVRPTYRGGVTGYRLARIYRDWARGKGATTLYFDVNSGVDNQMAGKLACKLGFRHIGDAYKAVF